MSGNLFKTWGFDRARMAVLLHRTALAVAITSTCLFAASCAKQGASPADQSHATVLMRDGTTLTGNVTTTSPTEITLAGDDGQTHTVQMKQVKSIEYDDAVASASGAAASAGGAAPARASGGARGESAAVHEHHYHPTKAEIHTKTYELPVGTEVSVRTEETIDSGTAAEGQTYAGEIAEDVVDAAGDVVIPRGSNAQIVIRSASKGGRIRGASDLVLDVQSVAVEGQEYVISTTDLKQTGKQGVGANKRTAEYTGGGAAVGAIIGAIAGHGKGAAIGAGAGAGAGALTQILTKGGSIKVPAETVLQFKLDKPVKIVLAQ